MSRPAIVALQPQHEPLTSRIFRRLSFIYGDAQASDLTDRVLDLIETYRKPARALWSEKDTVLITYGNTISRRGEAPLATLNAFLKERLPNTFSCVHLLPFFPYSSDDGFAVVDYRRVSSMLGDWNDIERLSESFDLMMDLVLNHASSHSDWFKQFLGQQLPGRDFFIEVPPESDVSQVVRPRAHPLVVTFDTEAGPKHVWATFSEDQLDLNFENPKVLLEMLSILLFYVQMGARIVRLDAVAFLWKRLGTNCIHLDETHEVVKLMRDIVQEAAPGTIIVTETNVPHAENVSYFGHSDEAHMVYQFSLPPLTLHALHRGSSHYLTEWASNLAPPPEGCTFLNFTASHDGVGMRPVEGILPQAEIELLIAGMGRFGGYASARDLGNGRKAVYELNITYFDALKGTAKKGIDGHQVARFLCSQVISLSLQGIPALYVQSLIAAPCDHEGVDQTGRFRSVNRKRWAYETVLERLDDPISDAHAVFEYLKHAIAVRGTHRAFHPESPQKVHRMGDSVFVLERGSDDLPDGRVLVIANVTDELQTVSIPAGISFGPNARHLLTGTPIEPETTCIELGRYQVVWLALN